MSYLTDRFDQTVVKLLMSGAVGFMPSDTIYGLSCRALDEVAVERLRSLKGKASSAPLIVLIANIEMLDLLSIDKSQAVAADGYWPGPLSLEFAAPDSPAWLHRGTGHFAIRLPKSAALTDLIEQTGPLVSTSANLHGGRPAISRAEAERTFGHKLDFYVDAGRLDNPPSTLAVIKNGRLKVVRPGAVKIKQKET